ncbi:MAG: PEGA domain-containing protein [Patescibacteria group bacterium]|nr:PEGA domain-containing protein [Patescibacteria group bacterium]MDD4610454.1 PEGA domain-containing protein [Patescibacteria group bacterium]
MTYRTRSFLFIIFIFLFFIIAPLSIFYAAGYKLKLTWPLSFNNLVQKTGMFVFNTEPQGAKIYLNNELTAPFLDKYITNRQNYLTTPNKIKNIMPGEYDVKLELDGYWTWEKKLKIVSGQSTHAEDVRLFKKNLPFKLTNSTLPNFKVSPDNQYIAFQDSNKLKILNLNNSSTAEYDLTNTQSKPASFIWAPDSKKIIANNFLFNFDLEGSEMKTDLSKIISPDAFNIKWSDDSLLIYFQAKLTLNSYNINNKIITILNKKTEITDYKTINNTLFYITKINNVYFLRNNQNNQEIELPASPQYKFIDIKNNLLYLLDAKRQILYLINPFSQEYPFVDIINNVNKAILTEDKRLLYANDFEIWLYSPETKSKILLTRISEPIVNIAWHKNNNYAIYYTANAVRVIELDDREKRNVLELMNAQQISFPFFDSEQDIVYFYAKIGNEQGIFELEL